MCSDARILLPLLLWAVSCSVKEDRTACPCSLELDIAWSESAPLFLRVQGEDYCRDFTVERDTVLMVDAPRPWALVTAEGGVSAFPEGEEIRIPDGEEAPPLFLFTGSVSTAGEQARLVVLPHKEYCRAGLTFRGPPGYGPPFEVRVVGTVDGWTLAGKPLPGPFSCNFTLDGEGTASCRLPRQRDDSLLMQIVFGDRVVRTFALGEYLAAAGYDWSAPSLEDTTLEMDISLTEMNLQLDLWIGSRHLEILV